jgi:anti-sigma B factor antagonist
MKIEITKNTKETVIQIEGRLDTITAPTLDKTISEDLGDTTNLVLNLKGMEYISSAGLRVLLTAQKKMQKIGSMKLINVSEEVMEVLEMTGFADILTIEQ